MKERAQEALQRGDTESALALWREISGPGASPADLLEHILLLLSLQCSAETGPLLKRLVEHPAATPGELLPTARALFQIGRFAASSSLSGRALALAPDDPDIAAMHAANLERTDEIEPAIELLDRVLARHPAHARSIRLQARIERRKGALDAARDRLTKALASRSTEDDWRLRYELATTLDRLGEYSAAMTQLLEAKAQLQTRSAAIRPAWRAMTRRQWEVAEALDPHRLEAWSDSSDLLEPAMRLCLMAGFPRSGTTLLERILTAHPDCLGTDETGILATQFRDPLIMEATTAAEALAELDDFDAASVSAGRGEYLRCTTDRLGEAPGGRLILEKDPLLTADLAVPLRLFPEASILMPLRDPRDVVLSFFFTMVPLAPNSVAAANLEDSCRYYAEVMRHWLLLRERLDPARWTESRYEDLIGAPEKTLRPLVKAIGLTWDPALLDHHRAAQSRPVATPSYDDVAQPLYRRSLARWRNYERWLAPHFGTLDPFLKAFGYA